MPLSPGELDRPSLVLRGSCSGCGRNVTAVSDGALPHRLRVQAHLDPRSHGHLCPVSFAPIHVYPQATA